MARAATTSDVFNAIAEPKRRAILDVLAVSEQPVNELAQQLGLSQPQLSKHLRVLREVDAVRVRDQGRRRIYRIHGDTLKPVHDWVAGYEHLWAERLDRLDRLLTDLKEDRQGGDLGGT